MPTPRAERETEGVPTRSVPRAETSGSCTPRVRPKPPPESVPGGGLGWSPPGVPPGRDLASWHGPDGVRILEISGPWPSRQLSMRKQFAPVPMLAMVCLPWHPIRHCDDIGDGEAAGQMRRSLNSSTGTFSRKRVTTQPK
jgi:hypothetical protein